MITGSKGPTTKGYGMVSWLISKIRKFVGFTKNTLVAAIKVIVEFVKETAINSPAVIIMSFSAFGMASTLTKLGVSSLFLPVPFINEVAIVSVLSVIFVLVLATISGNIAEASI